MLHINLWCSLGCPPTVCMMVRLTKWLWDLWRTLGLWWIWSISLSICHSKFVTFEFETFRFGLFLNRSFCSKLTCIFPLGHFVFTLHHCIIRAGRTWHCTTSPWQWQQQHVSRVKWVPNVGHTNNSEVYTIRTEWLKGRSYEPSNCRHARQQHIKVQDNINHVDKWCFGTSCQAAHIKAICSGCWVCWVLRSLQTSRSRVPIESSPSTSSSPSPLGCFVLHQRSKWAKPRGKCPFVVPLYVNQMLNASAFTKTMFRLQFQEAWTGVVALPKTESRVTHICFTLGIIDLRH